MISVLSNHIPARTYRGAIQINPTEAAIDYGRALGYMECLELIQSLSEFPDQPAPEVEMDYGADKILAEEEQTPE